MKLFKKKSTQTKQVEKKSTDEGGYKKGEATIRDLIAPSALSVNVNYLQVGDTFSKTIFIIAYPKFLNTNWFSSVINIDFALNISMFIHPVDTTDVIKQLRKSATQVQSEINIEAESGKIRDPILETAMENIEELRTSLQTGTEKFFRFGVYITFFGENLEELGKIDRTLEAVLEAQLVYIKPAVVKMEQGF